MATGVYLNFSGNCRAAVEFYADAFGVEPGEIVTYGEAGADQVDAASKDLVMHAEIRAMGSTLMFSDVFQDVHFAAGSNVGMVVTSEDEAMLWRLYEKLSAGGAVGVPLQNTLFSSCYGWLTDKFGVSWQMSHMATSECAPPA